MKELQSLDDIFNKKLFRIPDYQRGYAWGTKQFVEFWEDLINLHSKRSHYTGVLSVQSVPEVIWSNWNEEKWLIDLRRYKPFYIVDGQQRITTISIFIQCLVEVLEKLPENKGVPDRDIYLGSYSLYEIKEKYIVVTEPKHRTMKTYKFGYDTDNPSFEFLRHRIFNEPNAGTISETFYTLNLEDAKKFFLENITNYINEHGNRALESVYEKLTERFLFNLYELTDNFDVFVAFETMNNRGRQLSDLELLKNRLIYLTTLYAPEEVSDDMKQNTRKKINDAWKEIYHQLGRNKTSPLNDDEFLRAHWIMYFKYSRVKGNDYIRYLLDDYFSPKHITGYVEVSAQTSESYEEIKDIIDDDEDDLDAIEQNEDTTSIRTITQISEYVDSLKQASKKWFSTYFPENNSDLTPKEQLAMDRINRVKIGHFRPLIMAAFIKYEAGDELRLALLDSIERFIFVGFRVCRFLSNYRSSSYYRAARSVYIEEMNLTQVMKDLQEDLQLAFDENGSIKTSLFSDFIDKKYARGGDGFYAWNDLRYFLFEYEEHKKVIRNTPKLGWENFIKSEKDKVSIEHIYPQTATSEYWSDRFSNFDEQQQKYLRGSLGNLLPLSASINSSLQNDDFPDKVKIKVDDKGNAVRTGYKEGSFSEMEVAEYAEWTAEEIKIRGLKLLNFMEQRWSIDFGGEGKKLSILHLSFLNENHDTEPEEMIDA